MRFSTATAVAIIAYGYVASAVDVDVAIVGGGLSGLAAARDLIAGGKSVVVLEARNRVGGRVYNAKLANGGVTEVGAQFVGPTQDRVIALADSLGLTRYNTYNNGSNVLYENGTLTPYEVSGPNGAAPPIDYPSLEQVGYAQYQLDVWASEIDVNAPWAHPSAQEWDSMTFASWLDSVATLPAARFILDVATTSIFSAEPSELSLLYTIAYIASSGNETLTGSLERLTETANGAQEQRIVGGTQLLAIKLAERIGSSRIILNAPVRKIKKLGDSYYLTADTTIVRAKSVVIAMSPPLAARISYDPILPASRDQLSQRLHMGSIGKAIAIYSTPFWRADSLNGQAVSDTGIVRSTYDSSPPDASYGALMGFIEADEMRAFDDKSEDEIKAAVLQDYVRYFGPKAANVTSWVIQRWDNEEWSRGGPVAYAPPGVLTKYGPALTKAFGGIHFAGTESANYWTGYMDGAIRSGERVAKEILAA
jgi:monoamine oxidase